MEDYIRRAYSPGAHLKLPKSSILTPSQHIAITRDQQTSYAYPFPAQRCAGPLSLFAQNGERWAGDSLMSNATRLTSRLYLSLALKLEGVRIVPESSWGKTSTIILIDKLSLADPWFKAVQGPSGPGNNSLAPSTHLFPTVLFVISTPTLPCYITRYSGKPI